MSRAEIVFLPFLIAENFNVFFVTGVQVSYAYAEIQHQVLADIQIVSAHDAASDEIPLDSFRILFQLVVVAATLRHRTDVPFMILSQIPTDVWHDVRYGVLSVVLFPRPGCIGCLDTYADLLAEPVFHSKVGCQGGPS